MIAKSPYGQSKVRVRVRQVDPRTDPRWNAFVVDHPDGWTFHSSDWLDVIQKTYGFEPAHLICEDEAASVRGVFPLFRVDGALTGRGLYSLPRSPQGGPLVLDNHAAESLIDSALGSIDRSRGQILDVRMRTTWLSGLVDGVTARPLVSAFRLELPEAGTELRFGNSANHSKIKRAVNKAEREGVVVRPAETESDLKTWYSLYLETMRSHGTIPRPYRLMRYLWTSLGSAGLMQLLLAEVQKHDRTEIIAGSVFVTLAGKTAFLYNGRRPDSLPLRPNDAIMWRAIHDAHAAGQRQFDFGEVPAGNTGLAEFKTKWCGKPEQLYLYRYPFSKRPGPESHSRARRFRQMLKPIWRRLPLRVTEELGDFINSNF